MAKRTRIEIEDIADPALLERAFWRAASGKRARREVRLFSKALGENLARLRAGLLSGGLALGAGRSFFVHDPKKRLIHAPAFPERIVHHALMEKVSPALEGLLVEDTFACRVGKGSLAAVMRAQQHLRRFPYFTKVDVRAYFASIDHSILEAAIRKRIKGRVLELISAILGSHGTEGRGLPIGALTSQHFANFYLGAFDRFVLDQPGTGGYVRYMDDMVWFYRDEKEGSSLMALFEKGLRDRYRLDLKRPSGGAVGEVVASRRGLSFCGFRIFAERLALSPRRKLRYRRARRRWEEAAGLGLIEPLKLQAGYSAALATIAAAASGRFRAADLRVRPAPEV